MWVCWTPWRYIELTSEQKRKTASPTAYSQTRTIETDFCSAPIGLKYAISYDICRQNMALSFQTWTPYSLSTKYDVFRPASSHVNREPGWWKENASSFPGSFPYPLPLPARIGGREKTLPWERGWGECTSTKVHKIQNTRRDYNSTCLAVILRNII